LQAFVFSLAALVAMSRPRRLVRARPRDDARAATSVAADQLHAGTSVNGFVVCHHEYGIGVYVGEHDQ
jgi:hypothetical protein